MVFMLQDVFELANILPNLYGFNKISDPKFNHMDFLYAKDIKVLLYDQLLLELKKFE